MLVQHPVQRLYPLSPFVCLPTIEREIERERERERRKKDMKRDKERRKKVRDTGSEIYKHRAFEHLVKRLNPLSSPSFYKDTKNRSASASASEIKIKNEIVITYLMSWKCMMVGSTPDE